MTERQFRKSLDQLIEAHRKRLKKLLEVKNGSKDLVKVSVTEYTVRRHKVRAHDRWIVR
jgi:hypothetical protein